MNQPSATPPDPPTTQVQLKPSSALPWLLLVVGTMVVVVLFLFGFLRLPSGGNSAAEKDRWLQELAEHNDEFSQLLDESRRQTDWENANRTLQALQVTLNQLTQETKALEDEFTRLLQTDAGRGVAANPERIQQFSALRSSERMSPTEIANYAAMIPKYQAICEQALADRTIVFDPQQSFGTDIAATLKSVEGMLEQIQQDRAALDALVQSAGNAPATAASLNEASDALAQAQSQQLLQQLTAEKERLRQESEARVRAAELEAEQARLAAEERIRVAEAQAQVDRAEQMAAAKEQELAAEKAQQEKVAEFEKQLPRMRELLSPMISSGKMQLDEQGNWYEDEPGPLSLAVLKPLCYGQVKNPSTFALMNIFSNPNQNDRPGGSWPPALNSEAPLARKAAQFILDYGELLIEKGLLRP